MMSRVVRGRTRSDLDAKNQPMTSRIVEVAREVVHGLGTLGQDGDAGGDQDQVSGREVEAPALGFAMAGLAAIERIAITDDGTGIAAALADRLRLSDGDLGRISGPQAFGAGPLSDPVCAGNRRPPQRSR